MMEWFAEARAPLGILMFAGMFLALTLRRMRAKKAGKEFPDLAAELGLVHKPSNFRRGIGTLSGKYRGYQVHVDPEDQRRISVQFDSSPNVDMRSYVVGKGAPPGMRPYFTGDKLFDDFFKTHFASEEVAARLQEVEAPRDLIEAFRGTYYRQLKQVNITHRGVSCVLDFGNPPHLPAKAVAQLLPAMADLAAVIEPHDGQREAH